MNSYTSISFILITCALFISCEQKISVKDSELTAINPLSYTDVIYKSDKDTVLTATFDGKIRQCVNGESEKQLIIDVSDEVYNLAYNADKKLIYAATLNSGILIISEEKSSIEKALPLEEKWARKIHFDPNSKVLMTTDFGGNSYLWQTDNDYEPITIPEEFSEKTAKTISDGVVYFDGKGTAAWDLTNDQIQSNIKVRGEIVDTDKEGNVLALSHNEFMFYNDDSLQFRGKHPDWPIYVESIDTLFHAPASLYLTTGILSESSIFTASTDRSIRSWNKEDGTLIDDLLGHRATVSAMDLSKSETQLVSVDLKGGLKFWDLK